MSFPLSRQLNRLLGQFGLLCLLLNPYLLWPPAQAQPLCSLSNLGMNSMQSARIGLRNRGGDVVEITALLAADNQQRASGFQYVCPSVIESTYILFRYPSAQFSRFHMRNVHAPLDIGFFAANGRLLSVMRMDVYTSPTVRPVYGPEEAFQYALEARVGFFAEHALRSGSRLLLETLP